MELDPLAGKTPSKFKPVSSSLHAELLDSIWSAVECTRGESTLKIIVCRFRLFRRFRSDQIIGAEYRYSFMHLLGNLIKGSIATPQNIL